MNWRPILENVRGFFHGMAFGRFEHHLRQEAMDLNDLFLLTCHLELIGLPNPVALHLLEIYPYFLDEFHLWHRRMGFKRSPLTDFSCC